jgi:radical SAM superfamily enzyme YgiQ (UPF0313 family)
VAKIVIINPRFEESYWGMEHALPLFGKRANLPVACLPLLAALTLPEHTITLIDENVTPLDFDLIAQADIVGVTGMIVQRFRMREILEELRQRDAFVVVGGPWVTVKEDYFGDLADVIFVGEAEDTWPTFLSEWEAHCHRPRYEQAEKTDMTRVPCPRYDQIDAQHYMFGSLQISRGCPFQCEFCDIIVTFGRRPRLKTGAQVVKELKALRQSGMEMVFIVDDNLIGNKKAIAPVLQDVANWQQANGYPFIFFTEASLDLADDAELMKLMVAANIQAVFVGIESPNAESLRETLKFQNLRAGGTMLEKVNAIQTAGMEVWTGMILGFDHDDETIFDAQYDFIRDGRIVHSSIGMLSAIPKTPLYDRLLAENRLDLDDAPACGTNVIPVRMSREALRDGYIEVMERLNDPKAYFDRVDSLYHDPAFRFNQAQQVYWRQHPWSWLKSQSKNLIRSAVLYRRLMRHVAQPELREEYRRRLAQIWRVRRDPAALFIYVIKSAMHYHYYRLTHNLKREDQRLINTF